MAIIRIKHETEENIVTETWEGAYTVETNSVGDVYLYQFIQPSGVTALVRIISNSCLIGVWVEHDLEVEFTPEQGTN